MNSVFNSVPSIIKNDASQAFASFLFAEGKDLFSENKGRSVDVPQPMPGDKDQPVDISDEHAQSASGPVATDPHSLVNDDLAACEGMVIHLKKSSYSFLSDFAKSVTFVFSLLVNDRSTLYGSAT